MLQDFELFSTRTQSVETCLYRLMSFQIFEYHFETLFKVKTRFIKYQLVKK